MMLMSQKAGTCCQRESNGDQAQMLIIILDILTGILPEQPLLYAHVTQAGACTLQQEILPCCSDSDFLIFLIQCYPHQPCSKSAKWHGQLDRAGMPTGTVCQRSMSGLVIALLATVKHLSWDSCTNEYILITANVNSL